MIFDSIEFFLDLLSLSSNSNSKTTSTSKEYRYAITFSCLFLVASLILLIVNKEVFSVEQLFLLIIASLILGLIASLIIIYLMIFCKIMKPLEVQSFVFLLLSSTVLFTSIIILINAKIKVIQ